MMLTAANMTTKKTQEVLATDAGRLLVENVDGQPFYEQYEPHDLGSEEVAAAATEYLPAFAVIGTLKDKILLVTITGDGTASIGIDVAMDLTAGYVPNWHRWETPLGTGKTKTSGLGGKIVLLFPADTWIRYVRVWVTETGGVNTVTVAAKVGGRP